MSDTYAPPSINPADEDTLVGTFQQVFRKFIQGQLDDCLPARVIAYDRDTNRATVQPQIMVGTTDGRSVNRAQIASVTVAAWGGGGFVLSFPIKPGDLGWIKATDRDLSLYMQANMEREELPNTTRMHTFQDGFFLPDTMMRMVVIDPADAERMVLQQLDGATRIALGEGTVDITAPTSVTIDSPTVTITGDLVVDGKADVAGEVTGNGIELSTHPHSGVQPGGGNSGPPVP